VAKGLVSPEQIPELLNSGEPVRVKCGSGSLLRVDRPLPFLCLYRAPSHQDLGTRSLITNEASYLIVGPEDKAKSLIQPVVNSLFPIFGTFLILEVCAGESTDFQIHTSKDVNAKRLGTKFEEYLQRATRDPIRQVESKMDLSFESHVILNRVEVPTFYQSPDGEPFPLVLRSFRRRFTRSVRRLFHHFIRTHTPLKPANFQTLGPRAMVKAAWEVDEALQDLSRSFSFLLQITPVNVEDSWRAFRKSDYSKPPEFLYRPFPADPTELKRRLYSIPVHKVDDATLNHIFREKQRQLELKITMVERRRTPDFLYSSLSLYGGVEQTLVDEANAVLDHLPKSCTEPDSELVGAEEFAETALREVAYYRDQWEGFTPDVIIREDMEASILCDHGNLLVGGKAEVPRSRVAPLIHHEVGTHLVTYYNGKAQPLRQLSLGLADFLELQEGLAVLSEFLTGPLSKRRMQYLALRVLAVKMMIEGAHFVDTFQTLRQRCKVPLRVLFGLVVRVYRGGGFTKDAVYLRGLVQVLNLLASGEELQPLFVGKIARHHVPLVRELQWRKVLQPAPLVPRVLSIPEAQERLERLKEGKTVVDLCGF